MAWWTGHHHVKSLKRKVITHAWQNQGEEPFNSSVSPHPPSWRGSLLLNLPCDDEQNFLVVNCSGSSHEQRSGDHFYGKSRKRKGFHKDPNPGKLKSFV